MTKDIRYYLNQDIRYYLNVFLRRLPLFLLVFSLISATGLLAALTLPPVFQSQMRLVVESSQIPDALARSTVEVPAEEQLQLFETRLLTRENLLEIANRLRPLPDQAKMSPDQIVQAMRAATTIISSSGRDKATLMTLAFESRDPTVPAKVLDAYLSFLLNEDAQYRTGRAGQTQAFFQQEVERLGGSLSQQSERIVAFKNQNEDALPDGLNYRRDLLLNLQERIAQNDRDRATLQEQKQRITQIFEATGRVGAATGTQLSPQEQYIQTLKSQLAEMQAVYAPTSPRVITLQNRINQLEASLAESRGETTAADSDPTRTMYNLQLSELEARLDQLAAERARIDKQVADVQDQINRTASNAIALEGLERDYDNIQLQYNRASDSLAQASTGERIEVLSRGQRVSVVERPAIPTQPIRPSRSKVAMAGIGGGLAAGLGLIWLLEMLSTTIKRSKDMVSGLGITPMVTIPYIRPAETPRQVNKSRLLLSLLIGLLVPVLLWLVHAYVMPFNEIIESISTRLGFGR